MSQASYNDQQMNEMVLQTIQKYLENEISVNELIEHVETREQEIENLRKSFNLSVASESKPVQEFCSDAVQLVDACFDYYRNALESIKEEAFNNDRESIEKIVLRLDDSYNRLNLSFLTFRNDALVARGPTSHGGINLIFNDIQMIKSGMDAVENLRNDVFMETTISNQAINSLTHSPQGHFSQGLLSFYEEYREVLACFDDFFNGGAMDILITLEEDILELGGYYRRVDIDYQLYAYSSEPTSLPLINLVINTGRNYIEENGEKTVFQYFFEEFHNLFNQVKFRYDELKIRQNPANAAEQEESEKLGRALEDINEGLLGLEEFMQTEDIPLYEECRQILIESAEVFAESVENMKRLSEESGKIQCFKCGFKNLPGRMTCTQCRALLPQMEKSIEPVSVINTFIGEEIHTESVSTGPRMTVYVKQLFDSALGYAEGKVSADEFNEQLFQMESRYKNACKQVKDVPPVTKEMIEQLGQEKANELHEKLKQAANDYKEGLEYFSKGLDFFVDFEQTLSTQAMQEAKDNILHGMERLQRSQAALKEDFIKENGG